MINVYIFQIKEGAENLRKVAKDKKSVSDVNHIVKKSINKLSELQAELQELDSQLLVTQGNLPTSPLVGEKFLLKHLSVQLEENISTFILQML